MSYRSRAFNFPAFNFDVFEETFDSLNKEKANRGFPFSDVYVNEEEGVVFFDMAVAGYEKDKIEIEIKDNQLIVTYDSNDPQEENSNLRFIERGIARRDFKRVWKLGPQVDVRSGKASFEDGILTIKFNVEKKDVLKISID